MLANRWLEDGLSTPFVLHTAAELSSALAVLDNHPVDLTILDLNLSDSSGLDTFRTVFAHAGDVPIVVLSGEMMLRHLGCTEAADLIIKGLNGAIGSKRVTYDFARLMPGATQIKCSEFGDNLIAHM